MVRFTGRGEAPAAVALALGADEPELRLSILEQDQGRDAHDIEAPGELKVLVDVDLANPELADLLRAISSSTGATILHGPHHSAQKSTRTGSVADLISSSNV